MRIESDQPDVRLDRPCYLLVVPHDSRVLVVSEGEPLYGRRFDGIAVFGTPDPEWLEAEVSARLRPQGTHFVE